MLYGRSSLKRGIEGYIEVLDLWYVEFLVVASRAERGRYFDKERIRQFDSRRIQLSNNLFKEGYHLDNNFLDG
jgi:hypothetical protein